MTDKQVSFTIQFTAWIDPYDTISPADYIDREGLEQVLENYGYESVNVWKIEQD